MGKEKGFSAAERFWARVQKGEGCWEWQGPRNQAGYGQFENREFKTKIASRVSWILTNGPIPEGLLACHKCDNPPCVRPDHLFLGTHRDNSLDMVAKKRGSVGKTKYEVIIDHEGMVNRTCSNCGTPTLVRGVVAHNKYSYCSRSCQYKHMWKTGQCRENNSTRHKNKSRTPPPSPGA